MMTSKKPLISIVVPVYREAKNLLRMLAALDALDWQQVDREYLFVNDGSPDDSIHILQRMAADNPRVRVIDFARNFGKEAALTAGLDHANGDAVICIDADLQHPPALIPKLIEHWKRGAEVVVTIRQETEQPSILRRVGSSLFYWLLGQLSEVDIVAKTTDFRLIDRAVVDAFKKLPERERVFRGLIDWLGFRRVYVPFEADERAEGTSSYSYARLFDLFLNGIMAHSVAPLRWVGLLGLLIVLGSTGLLAFMFGSEAYDPGMFGFTPLAKVVVGNTLLIGILLTALGIVAIYVARIHAEVLGRPIYLTRSTRPVSSVDERHIKNEIA